MAQQSEDLTCEAPVGEAGERLQELEEPTAEELSSLLQQLKEEHGLMSVLFGLWIDDKEVLTEALGYSMTDVPATRDMHFRTGSITISVLTTLLLQAVERGEVALDDTLSTWFPDLPQAKSVTLRMLANSTSGYADYVYTEAFREALKQNPFRQWQAEELLQLGMAEEPLFEPGTDFHYAHTNFVLLEEVLAQVTGPSTNLSAGIVSRGCRSRTQSIRWPPMVALHSLRKSELRFFTPSSQTEMSTRTRPTGIRLGYRSTEA